MIKAILFTTIISATLGAGAAVAQDSPSSTIRVFNYVMEAPHWGQRQPEFSAFATTVPTPTKTIHLKKGAVAGKN
ncbi:MAG: hypothetical protein P4L76_06540 [Beijerinckiaceae bacterium]|nr:hypothetical protein [Beijerinckiaceae bacterium]